MGTVISFRQFSVSLFYVSLSDMFMVCHVWKPVDVGLKVTGVEALILWQARDVRRKLIKFIAYGG